MAKKATLKKNVGNYGSSKSAKTAKKPLSGLNAKSTMKGLYKKDPTKGNKTFMQRLKGGAE